MKICVMYGNRAHDLFTIKQTCRFQKKCSCFFKQSLLEIIGHLDPRHISFFGELQIGRSPASVRYHWSVPPLLPPNVQTVNSLSILHHWVMSTIRIQPLSEGPDKNCFFLVKGRQKLVFLVKGRFHKATKKHQ